MPIPLGVLAVAGAGAAGGGGSFDLLETTLITTTTTSVTFSNLGNYSAYKHLQIRAVARSDSAGTWDLFFLRVNGDTGSNYANHKLRGTGSSVVSEANASDSGIGLPRLPRIDIGTNAYTAAVIDVLDFGVATKNKTIRALGGTPGTNNEISLASGFRDNTAAITSLTFSTPLGNGFAANSRFSLYGIK